MNEPITAILHNDGSISILHWAKWNSKNDLEKDDAFWIEKSETTFSVALKRMQELRIVFKEYLS